MTKTLNVFLGLAVAGSAFAATPTVQKPLLSLVTSSATVAPEYRTSSRCDVFANKIAVQNTAGALHSTQVQVISLQGKALKNLVEAAAKGKLTKTAGPVGAPASRSVAFLDGKEVVLAQSGAEVVVNDAKEAATLINFLKLSCN